MKKLFYILLFVPYVLIGQYSLNYGTFDTLSYNNTVNTIFYDNFESGVSSHYWSSDINLDTITYNSTNILGNFSNESISLSFNELPPHYTIYLSFDLYIFDTWDCYPNQTDIFGLSIDNTNIIYTNFANNQSCNQCFPSNCDEDNNTLYPGYEGATLTNLPDLMGGGAGTSVYNIRLSYLHGNDSLLINFFGSELSPSWDESWGITNIRLGTE